MNIKNIVMGVAVGSLILAAAAPAFATEWRDVGDGYEIDKTTLTQLSNGWDMWIRIPAKAYMMRVEINCDESVYTILAGGTYTSRRSNIDTFRSPDTEAAAPGTLAGNLIEGFCTP